MTDTQRHPDIEIYIKDRSLDQIIKWLEQVCHTLHRDYEQGQVHHFIGMLDQQEVPVMVHEKVSGKAWTSVWFNSDQTPWMQDLDCAKQAASELDTQIRCIASGWNTGDDPDEWWKIEQGNTEKIQWRT
ncbi:hypothetical protein [Amphritea balenae]|uniref:Uncharacterized protein n=1 Tax=Amphritea balenae TaxID=452629 RepID=A0A3P1SR86_9GAMM|nr:hypothetical protein [Amphritea balenae]RRC99678.1 hypothetical protein EHS89_09310 [Amphritea balenae]GGK78919.1 hypothetical protein GCM10007941_31450 [Amphritea balenae]